MATVETLNKDIKLVSDDFGVYDFGVNKQDFILVTGEESLKNALILAVLTSWNELSDLSTYIGFGNRAYELVKANQNKLTQFKVEQYMKETVEKIRRVKKINELIVTPVLDGFEVIVNVTGINDEDVKVELNLNQSGFVPTNLVATSSLYWCNPNNPLQILLNLKDGQGNPIVDEVLYIYINGSFIKSILVTEETGKLFEYTPTITKNDNKLKIIFKGNNTYQPTNTEITFASEV